VSASEGFRLVPCPPRIRLSDGRISLRPFDPGADAERYAQVRMDPESTRWGTRVITGDPVDDTRRVLTEIATNLASGELWYLAAELDGKLAGRVSLRMDGAGGAELGFGVHPDSRGRGVAGSASSLLCRHGFDQLGLTVVRWHSFVGNWPSRRVAWRLGFSFDGTERRRLARAGQPLADAWGGTLLPEDLDRPSYLWLAVPDLDLAGDGPARRLRAPAERDLASIVTAMADPAARTYLHLPADYRQPQAEAFLAQIREEAALGTDLTWVVVDAGNAVQACLTLDLRSWELGWWGHPAARGRGVVTSGVRRVARYAFETLRANRLVARCAESNSASARVAELAGMRAAGRLRGGHAAARRGAGTGPDRRGQDGTRNEDTLLFDLVPADLTRTPPG
jgi:RimJ/RimL family protein N-acetyltransferase